ncbi:MAG: TIGR03000 domain-containing protein [Gemmataceae bacterium]
MRRALFAAVLAVAASAAPAKAGDWPTTTSATFPLLTPSGYYSNTYYYGWAYPWFAYYNYAHGPYANWAYYGPYATYGWGCYGCRGYADPFAGTAAATLVVDLPESAVLKFNGVTSPVTGNSRTFTVPALSYGQDYGYTLVAEVTTNGKTTRATAAVKLRAGETARVTLAPK